MYLDNAMIRKTAFRQIKHAPGTYLGAAAILTFVNEAIRRLSTRLFWGTWLRPQAAALSFGSMIRFGNKQELAFSLLNLVLSVLVTTPLIVGMLRLYIRAPYGDHSAAHLLFAYQNNFLSIAVAVISTDFIIGLWSMLLVVPGILKALEYSMVTCVVAESPQMSGGEARRLSRQMTAGVRGPIALLMLSVLLQLVLLVILAEILLSILAVVLFPLAAIVLLVGNIGMSALMYAYVYTVIAQVYLTLRYQFLQSQPAGYVI
jgi:hypothetical protein